MTGAALDAAAAPPASPRAALFMLAVQAGMRVASAVRDHRREAWLAHPIQLPPTLTDAVALSDLALGALSTDEGAAEAAARGLDLSGVLAKDAAGFFSFNPKADPFAMRRALEIALAMQAEAHPALAQPLPGGANPAGLAALQSWSQGHGGLWGRLALSMTDLCLEAIGANPGRLGLKGNAEVLVGALSQRLSALIPDDGAPSDPKIAFRERAISAVLRAGLEVASDRVDALGEESHLAALAHGLMAPMFARLDAPDARIASLADVREQLLAPMAHAGLTALAQHQAAFLGTKFGDTAIGAVTQGVLGAALAGDPASFRLTRIFSAQGLASVYESALSAAAKRPELFVTGQGAASDAGRKLLARFADAVAAAPPPFDDGLAAKLASETLDLAAEHLGADLDPEKPWDAVAATALQSALQGFKQGLANRSLGALFNRDQAVGLVRIVMAQAVKTPHMLTGAGAEPEVRAIVAALAGVMAQPGARLLSPVDWREIALAAVSEAAKNPGALFSTSGAERPESQLGAKLLGGLLEAAGAALSGGRKLGVVMFGETLREAMLASLRAAANNAAALAAPEALTAVRQLADTLNTLAAASQGRIGDREWLWLYRSFVADVIEKGRAPQWTLADVDALLSGRV